MEKRKAPLKESNNLTFRLLSPRIQKTAQPPRRALKNEISRLPHSICNRVKAFFQFANQQPNQGAQDRYSQNIEGIMHTYIYLGVGNGKRPKKTKGEYPLPMYIK